LSEIIGYEVDSCVVDTQSFDSSLSGQEIVFDNSPQSLEIIRHSCAHLMAQAIKQLYLNAKFFVGPVVEDGFYYDFKIDGEVGQGDLKTIEKTMQQLVKKKFEITKYSITKDEATEKFKDDELKQEVLKNIPDENISIYKQGEFEDLCRGPHLPNTKYLKFFKLTKIAGAYLGGDSSKEMLVRVYGTAFATKEALKEYLELIEEAKKRDHRKIGKELKLFTFDENLGAGLPIWLPNGARLRSKLEDLLFKAHRLRGYEPVRAPEILKADAWKTSGHYQNYKENMYFTQINEGDDENPRVSEYGIKPMNCVGHISVYKSDVRSYKDLPLKFFEYGVVHRHEMSGTLHGLFRVREFTQDDAHIYCTPGQIKQNVLEILEFVDTIMKNFGFKYTLEISTKPDKAIGEDEVWEVATAGLKKALDENDMPYTIDEGGGAFYGPKIDIKILDALKRKWQCGTIQVDFNLPQRFELEYVDEDNQRKQPVMIHRAILGSFERFIGILTEHCAGEFPLFISPAGVGIVPISEVHNEYSKQLARELLEENVDSVINDKNESLNKRIRTTEKLKVPFVLILGDEEVQNQTVSVRDRTTREQYTVTKKEFIDSIKNKSKVVF
jgi:threonyl-tRNA synthetase